MKQAVILGFLGQTRDRFSSYHEPATTEERMDLAGQLTGLSGVEIVYPYDSTDPQATLNLCRKNNLEIAAVNVNIKQEAQFVPGAASRPITEIRDEVVRYIHGSKDFAAAVGAPHVSCCPLSDGYDYLFQVDYREAWRNMVDVFGRAAAYRPEIPLFLEPKPSETRVHCHLDTTATTLLLLKDIGLPEMGVTLDFGHSLYAGENPARSLVAIVDAGFEPYIHTNDNDQRFDWDLIAGSRHLLHYAEFLFYAREIGYSRFFTTDASPRTLERLPFFERHLALSRALYERIAEIDRAEWFRLMREERTLALFDRVQREVYGFRA